MTPAWREFLDRSDENLAAAELCLERGFYNACANRTYFAVFQAALAALIHDGFAAELERPCHYWVLGNFSRRFVRERKVFPDRFGTYLLDMRESRIAADYKPVGVSKKVTERQIRKAREFVTNVREVVSNET